MSEYSRNYYKNNKARINKNQRNRYNKNKDIVQKYQREYYKKNPNKIKKIKEKWIKSHKEQVAIFRKRQFGKYKEQWKLIIVGLGLDACRICKYNRCYAAIDFHHIDPKEKEIGLSRIISGQAPTDKNVEKVINEAKKGIPLCCRCHRELHAGFVNLGKL